MKQIIDVDTWKRKHHYNFFKNFQEPFFSITTNVDCTRAYHYAKANNLSFFLYYMYQSLSAINAVEEFRYRIEGENVVCYDKVHCSTTTVNANDLFAFAYMPYVDTFEAFYAQTKGEMAKIRTLTTMNLSEDNARAEVIHYSTIPWFSFTSLTNERNHAHADSIPKISFGKFFKEGDKLLLPISVSAHHGLLDGSHVGKYLEIFQRLLDRQDIQE